MKLTTLFPDFFSMAKSEQQVTRNGWHREPAIISNGQTPSNESRAEELESLLNTTLKGVIGFTHRADTEASAHVSRMPVKHTALVEEQTIEDLNSILTSSEFLSIPSRPQNLDGFAADLDTILKYSVNTLSPGFMDKLYSAPVPPGIAADLILTVLNTNVHVYHVSPVLTLVEKLVTKKLASLFGLDGPRAGGINVQGGSASNATSLVIARNTLFPRTKIYGNHVDGLELCLFTSQHGHYSIEKAALSCGLGSASVIPVPVDGNGSMIPSELERLILEAKSQGKTPFYVNATAGTTVMGSFDPFNAISAIAKQHGMWMHIDGAWGGSFALSPTLRKKLAGSHLADSIATNPHKMMGVPIVCSFLLGRDLRQFHEANTLRAGYLFHDAEIDDEIKASKDIDAEHESELLNGVNGHTETEDWKEPDDLADLTLQCGRRGDALKLFMAWRYYGLDGYRMKIENAYDIACHMASLVARNPNFVLVSSRQPPCLQVCFYYAPHGNLLFSLTSENGTIIPPLLRSATSVEEKDAVLEKHNTKVTQRITKRLVQRGFMVDFAPALEGETWKGKFFRVVVNIHTPKETVERLLGDIEALGEQVVTELREEYSQRRRRCSGLCLVFGKNERCM
jgi:glutamate decarboxylase